MRLKLFVLAVLLFSLSGCTPIERTAYNLAVGSKAFLDSIKAKHPECTAVSVNILCTDLRKATAAKDILIDAGIAYCNEASFGTTSTTACKPAPKGTPAYSQTISALNSAISLYEQAEADLKGVVK